MCEKNLGVKLTPLHFNNFLILGRILLFQENFYCIFIASDILTNFKFEKKFIYFLYFRTILFEQLLFLVPQIHLSPKQQKERKIHYFTFRYNLTQNIPYFRKTPTQISAQHNRKIYQEKYIKILIPCFHTTGVKPNPVRIRTHFKESQQY